MTKKSWLAALACGAVVRVLIVSFASSVSKAQDWQVRLLPFQDWDFGVQPIEREIEGMDGHNWSERVGATYYMGFIEANRYDKAK